jgi:hypothetical protein
MYNLEKANAAIEDVNVAKQTTDRETIALLRIPVARFETFQTAR